ncbi:MAG: YibE/F family protein [Clostridia bacterium]|nr:YibE/F family protein [Clostridia bacterium]
MKIKNIILWITTVAISLVYLFVGHNIAARDLSVLSNEGSVASEAKVLSIEDTIHDSFSLSGSEEQANVTTIFTCKILDGDYKGDTVRAIQTEDAFAPITEKAVEEGDKIILLNYPSEEFGVEWVFGNYVRFDLLVIFAIFFFILILIFGRGKGVNTIISLAFTCAAIFLVYIPSILSGYNIYVSTFINCTFISLMSLLLITGWSRKTAATVLGCMFGFLVSSLLSMFLSSVLHLTGFVDEHSVYLTYLPTATPIDLKAIIFGGVVIGSLGAVIDVSMDISSALFELRRHATDLPFKSLVKSGISIGRDIIGTMANTLVLAYIGSALSTVLLLTTYAVSIHELLNREMIIAELLQALVGSTAILLTIPLTSIICGFMYSKKEKDEAVEDIEIQRKTPQ